MEPMNEPEMAGAAAEKSGKGILYLSATPIGNLEDMTFRGVRMLAEADLIAAEDTRHTRKLLSHYDIHTPVNSYHEHNKQTKGPELVAKLVAGNTIVCVSDAGLPGISDPGEQLAKLAIEAGIQVSPLPGANAALSALICSGISAEHFTFYGFLPKTAKKRQELLESIRLHQETLIFYEAPHHLKATLRQLVESLGADRPAAAARELTKRYEEFNRNTLGGLLVYYENNEPRGEFVLVVAGYDPEQAEAAGSYEGYDIAGGEGDNADPVALVAALEEQGIPRKEAMRQVAKKLGLSRREVYKAILDK